MGKTFGDVMRHWRDIRRFSQLALSAETGISSRHISFLETGRSKPSRGSVLTLARVLEMPKPAVNDALLAAGFAPEFPAHDLSDVDLEPMMIAIKTILDNHAPMPAVVIDGAWQIIGGNAPAMQMMQFLPFPKSNEQGSMCAVDSLLNDDPNDPVYLNWDIIAAWTLLQLQMEAAREGGDGPLSAHYNRLAADPRIAGKDFTSFSNSGPFLTVQVRVEDQILSLFTMLAEFTSAQDVNMSERRVELFFPADAETKAYFEGLA